MNPEAAFLAIDVSALGVVALAAALLLWWAARYLALRKT